VKPKLGDKEVEVLLEKPVNEVSQAEMTEHLSGRHGERTMIGRTIGTGATSVNPLLGSAV
jgi:hypothetical protein